MSITLSQIEAAYEISALVFEHKLTASEGAKELQVRHGLNKNSALTFIEDFRRMLGGAEFKRTMSLQAMDVFLRRIASDRGSEALARAIQGVHLHIEYYERKRNVTLRDMRSVVTRHEAQLLTLPTLAEREEAFQALVKKAIADSPSTRQARLQSASKMPVKVRAIVEVYYRSADVVAEVLHRASGTCERCHLPAPFLRSSDGTPYLEVHHKKQLARDGEDTVENAIALCANCHRELHYGQERS